MAGESGCDNGAKAHSSGSGNSGVAAHCAMKGPRTARETKWDNSRWMINSNFKNWRGMSSMNEAIH